MMDSGVTKSNTTVIKCGFVEPQKRSQTQIGQGIYSLSKRSNVPFVELVASTGYNKIISWGEIAEVPAGALVTVRNASYHAGDIWLNKGMDPCNKPDRIVVPVQLALVDAGASVPSRRYQLWPSYPVDVRGARRAYYSLDAQVAANVDIPFVSAAIRMRRMDGSMNTQNSLQYQPPPFGPGTGYQSVYNFMPNETLGPLPLTLYADVGIADDTRPHLLLDAADAIIVTSDMAQLQWPILQIASPTGTIPIPAAFYTVEY